MINLDTINYIHVSLCIWLMLLSQPLRFSSLGTKCLMSIIHLFGHMIQNQSSYLVSGKGILFTVTSEAVIYGRIISQEFTAITLGVTVPYFCEIKCDQ